MRPKGEVRTKERPFTYLQQAVLALCLVHNGYEFKGRDKKVAQALMRRGMLLYSAGQKNFYYLSPKGKEIFEEAIRIERKARYFNS